MTRLRCAILDDYLEPGPDGRGLVQNRRPGRRHRLQPAVCHRRGRRQRAQGFRDHLRHARAYAVSAHAVCGAAEPETDDHLGHAQRRDRHGGRQGPRRRAVRHAMGPRSHRAPDHGPDPGTDPQYRPRERAHACRRTLAEIRRHGDRGPDARRDRPRQARHQGIETGAGVRHERDRLEPEPDAGEVQGSRRRLRHQGRAVRNRRHRHHPCGAGPALARPGRARRPRAHEADRLSRQHRARADRRRGRAAGSADSRRRSRAPASTCSRSSRCRSIIRSASSTTSC